MADTLSGVFPVLPTIFDDTGELDVPGLMRVVEFAISCGVDGVVFPGLASEYDMLSLDERARLIGVVGEIVENRVTFIVGAGGPEIEASSRLAQVGARAGAKAAMVMTPRAIGPDLQALRRFYGDLGTTAGIPIMVQNAPAPMGLGLSAEDVLSIVGSVPEIAWVKEENMPCGQRISTIIDHAPGNLLGVFGGAGGRYITDELARGAVGTMPASETPELHVALMQAHRAGDTDRVGTLYEAVLPILMMQAVFRWRLTKEVLRRRGLIDSAFTRAPGVSLDEGDHRELSRILTRLEPLLVPTRMLELSA